MILHGIEYQRPTSLNMRILADHVTYSFLAFPKSIFYFCLGCYCGGYSQNGRSNLSSLSMYVGLTPIFISFFHCLQWPTFVLCSASFSSSTCILDSTSFMIWVFRASLDRMVLCS